VILSQEPFDTTHMRSPLVSRKQKQGKPTQNSRDARAAKVQGKEAGRCRFFRVTLCSLRTCSWWYRYAEVRRQHLIARTLTRQVH
jgi:hypothetical protein